MDRIESGTGRLFSESSDSEGSGDSGLAEVHLGDVLFGKLRPYLAKTWVADRAVNASTELLCLRPRGTFSRWLGYVVGSRMVIDWAVATSDGAKMPRTSWSKLGELRVATPPMHDQRSIADYLDRETARIDALIAAKRRMIEVTAEKEGQLFVRALVGRGFEFPLELEPNWQGVAIPAGWRVIALSQCLRQLTNGYVGPTRDILRDEGVRYIQSLHIKNGVIDFGRRAYFVDLIWHLERPRIHLVEGDVLIVQTGDIGQVAVVPEGFGEASCHALQIARVRPNFLSGEFLGAYLRSPYGYQSLLSRATGALHPHLERGHSGCPCRPATAGRPSLDPRRDCSLAIPAAPARGTSLRPDLASLVSVVKH